MLLVIVGRVNQSVTLGYAYGTATIGATDALIAWGRLDWDGNG